MLLLGQNVFLVVVCIECCKNMSNDCNAVILNPGIFAGILGLAVSQARDFGIA